METLVLDGKEFVKASKAAKDLGYTSDYVGQLCRAEKITAHLVGRTWYVNKDELGTHRVEKKRMSRIKAREQAKKSIEAHRHLVHPKKQNVYKKVDISYESDTSDLIPETRKLFIASALSKYTAPADEGEFDTEDSYVIENKGAKILMKGDLDVVDVTDVPVDPHMTVLTPSRIRKGVTEREEMHHELTSATRHLSVGEMTHTKHTQEPVYNADTEEAVVSEELQEQESFTDKLEARDISAHSTSDAVHTASRVQGATLTSRSEVADFYAPTSVHKKSALPYFFMVTVLIAFGFGSVCTTAVLTYKVDTGLAFTQSFTIDVRDTVEKIKLKI